MLILDKTLNLSIIKEKHNHFFEEMVKIVVDIEKEIIALDAELHVDLEINLLEQDSNQKDLWGANIYFNKTGNNFIEYTSLINIRPAQNNRGMEIQDQKTREKLKKIVKKLIIK